MRQWSRSSLSCAPRACPRSTSRAARPNSIRTFASSCAPRVTKALMSSTAAISLYSPSQGKKTSLNSWRFKRWRSRPRCRVICKRTSTVSAARAYSMQAFHGLRALNALGYGREDSGLVLNLVYNPQGPNLPPAQPGLEAAYKQHLGDRYGIVFNRLYTLANMPIQRFGSTLLSKGQFEDYMTLLHEAHRDANLASVMCR